MPFTDGTTTNPWVVTAAAAGAVWDGVTKYVQLIQWVDDNADIADNSNLIMTINGATLEATVQCEGTVGTIAGAVVWEISFSQPFPVRTFIVPTMGAGQVHIWCA